MTPSCYQRGAEPEDASTTYRFRLWRKWDAVTPRRALFIMLNPSTASGLEDDPTIRRCMSLASRWGYGELEVVNLFAYRSTDPAGLITAEDPVGPGNDSVITTAARGAELLVAAWGAHPMARKRAEQVLALLPGRVVHCLKMSGEGAPMHPLARVKMGEQPLVFRGA